MRSFTTSPRMVPSAPIQVPGQGPGAQVGSIAENSRGTAELYSKSQVVVPESSRSPMAEGADTIRAEDVMHSQVDVQQAEAGLLTSESDLSVGSAGASEQAQARDSQSFVDVDELQTFGFSDFLKRVARPPSISDYRANLEQLLEESNEHHRLENMTPLPPQAVFEVSSYTVDSGPCVDVIIGLDSLACCLAQYPSRCHLPRCNGFGPSCLWSRQPHTEMRSLLSTSQMVWVPPQRKKPWRLARSGHVLAWTMPHGCYSMLAVLTGLFVFRYSPRRPPPHKRTMGLVTDLVSCTAPKPRLEGALA